VDLRVKAVPDMLQITNGKLFDLSVSVIRLGGKDAVIVRERCGNIRPMIHIAHIRIEVENRLA